MHGRFLGRCLLALLPLVSAASFAQEAFTRQAANVRAGPDRSYPLVAQLGPGAPLRVMGCLDDWTWCDIAFDDNRGWVYGPYLLYAVPGDRVSLYTYGPSLGIAVIGFSLGGYWDEHYRQRPWYGGRADWERRAPPPRHAPAGLPPHAVYTPGMHADRGESRPAGHAPAAAPEHAARGAPGPASGADRGRPAPAPPARAEQHAPAQQNPRADSQHAETQPQRTAPREMQHAPVQQQHAPTLQQREPVQQHEPAQGREAPQRGPERGGGDRGGEGKPEREGR